MSDKRFALNEKVATILAQIACHENALPQGSPCSPVISNLIGHILDIHLVRLAESAGCSYSRYADDLTFSTNLAQFPPTIARNSAHNPHVWGPGAALTKLIAKSGFGINAEKVRMQYRDSRQEVTGLVVNRKVNIRREYRRRVRAMVHKLFTTGTFEFVHTTKVGAGTATLTESKGSVKQLHGMLGFIDGVDTYRPRGAGVTLAAVRKKEVKPTSKESMYRRFLMFKEFYNAIAPVIVCEGNSDNIYLLHAIRSLAAKYPQLATVKADGQIKLNVRLFRYSGKSTGRILGITGGAAPLGQLMLAYAAETKRFTARGMQFPVILLIDNDSAAAPLYNIIGQITGKKPKGTEPFSPVAANLYLAATPLTPPAKSSCIEDGFDAKTKAFTLGKKTFNQESEFDTDSYYGKMAFAEKVVTEQAAHIDFSGFAPLLSNISAAIDFHTVKFPLPVLAKL